MLANFFFFGWKRVYSLAVKAAAAAAAVAHGSGKCPRSKREKEKLTLSTFIALLEDNFVCVLVKSHFSHFRYVPNHSGKRAEV